MSSNNEAGTADSASADTASEHQSGRGAGLLDSLTTTQTEGDASMTAHTPEQTTGVPIPTGHISNMPPKVIWQILKDEFHGDWDTAPRWELRGTNKANLSYFRAVIDREHELSSLGDTYLLLVSARRAAQCEAGASEISAFRDSSMSPSANAGTSVASRDAHHQKTDVEPPPIRWASEVRLCIPREASERRDMIDYVRHLRQFPRPSQLTHITSDVFPGMQSQTSIKWQRAKYENGSDAQSLDISAQDVLAEVGKLAVSLGVPHHIRVDYMAKDRTLAHIEGYTEYFGRAGEIIDCLPIPKEREHAVQGRPVNSQASPASMTFHLWSNMAWDRKTWARSNTKQNFSIVDGPDTAALARELAVIRRHCDAAGTKCDPARVIFDPEMVSDRWACEVFTEAYLDEYPEGDTGGVVFGEASQSGERDLAVYNYDE